MAQDTPQEHLSSLRNSRLMFRHQDAPLLESNLAVSDTTPLSALLLFGQIFLFFAAQFVLIAGGAYSVVWQLGRERFAHRRIQPRPRAAQIRRELIWSCWSMLILSALLTASWWLSTVGWSRVYFDVDEHSWAYLLFTVVVMAVVHDSYYYWAHRFMHHPRVFRYVHKLHHGFTNPTPFASYAFHPLEAMIEVAFFAPLAFVMPMHPTAVGIYIVVLTILNVISHLGYEFYVPRLARWFITSTHHNLHHARGKGHFMLYFNFWDHVMGTNAEDYAAEMARIATRRRESRADEVAELSGVISART